MKSNFIFIVEYRATLNGSDGCVRSWILYGNMKKEKKAGGVNFGVSKINTKIMDPFNDDININVDN